MGHHGNQGHRPAAFQLRQLQGLIWRDETQNGRGHRGKYFLLESLLCFQARATQTVTVFVHRNSNATDTAAGEAKLFITLLN